MRLLYVLLCVIVTFGMALLTSVLLDTDFVSRRFERRIVSDALICIEFWYGFLVYKRLLKD